MKKTALAILLPSLSLSFAFAAPFDLDTTFGTSGKVSTPMGVGDAFIFDVKLRADGKLIVAGSSNNGADDDFSLARYNVDGTLDTTFGLGGTVTTDFPGVNAFDSAASVALQLDGRVLAAGTSTIAGVAHIAVARYSSTNGAPDTSFAGTGTLNTDLGTGAGMALQPDGNIVVAGTLNNDFQVVRYTPAGILDTNFNTTGKVVTDFGLNETASSVALQQDGKIVVAGSTSNGVTSSFAVARYTTGGVLDATFNAAGAIPGTITTSFGSYDTASSVTVQSDGKILVAGTSSTNGYNSSFAIARYTSTGILDTAFGGTGKVVATFAGFDKAYSVTLQSDGKILVSGSASNGVNIVFALARFNTNGSLDVTFNSSRYGTYDSSGKVTTNFNTKGDTGHATAVYPDGRIVVAGSDGGMSGFNEFAIVRYLGGMVSPYWYNASYGLLYNIGANGYASTELGTLIFYGNYAYSTLLGGWLWGDGVNARLYSYQYGWLYYSGDGDHWYYAANLFSWIYIADFSGTAYAGSAYTINYGWLYPNGDAIYFWSPYYGWLQVVGNGHIKSLTTGRYIY